jgi:phosphoribosylformylglycinamidine synthase subunit PurS
VKYRFEIIVSLKEGLLDPQGKAVQDALPTLGWHNVSEVRVGKHIEVLVESESRIEARAQVEEMARTFLSNPVIEEYTILVADTVSSEGTG